MPRHSAIVDHNADWGITKIFHRHHDGDWTYETVQDVTPVLEANKAAQTSGLRPDREFRRVASIPLVLVLEIEKKHGIDVFNRDHWPALRRLLNSNEYRLLRTDEGVL